jgi:hypothetical protein
MKNMSKKKLKTSEPFGSALWLNMQGIGHAAIVELLQVTDNAADSATGRLQLLGGIILP